MRNLDRLLAILLILSPAIASPQAIRVVDQGSFSITMNGQRAGREDFTVKGPPAGQRGDYQATATVTYGDRRLSPTLISDSLGSASSYVVEVRDTGADQEKWRGSIVRGRVRAAITSARGESQKEFIASEGAVILDDDVFHQYFFVTLKVTNGTLTVIIPRRNTQQTMRVAPAGNERITIGSTEIDSRHFVLSETGGTQRDVWVDSQGRVLKIAILARGIVALRDDPPR